jgi:hypothetical protein
VRAGHLGVRRNGFRQDPAYQLDQVIDMPRKTITPNRSDVRAHIAVLEDMGKKVTAVKYHSDGTFRLITSDHVSGDNASHKGNGRNPWDED